VDTQHLALLTRLIQNEVEFCVIGGIAAIYYGSSLITHDLDVAAPLDELNIPRIIRALDGTHPRFRMHPARPPLPDEPQRLKGFRNLCLATDIGVIDILGEVTGVGDSADVISQSQAVEVEPGLTCRVLRLEALIAAKRAAGRPKDLRAVAELTVILEKERDRSGETNE